jgi:hypothetical protein
MPSQQQQLIRSKKDVPDVILKNMDRIISQYEEISEEQEKRFQISQE